MKDRRECRRSSCVAILALIASLVLGCASTEQARSAWIPRNEVPATFEALTKGLVAVGQKYRVPGLAVAITCDEDLVYSNSFGYADVASGQLVHDNSLFRIASISKPITAIAILKLSEQNRLSLDDRVFGENGILGTEYGMPPLDSNIERITVGDLLEHRSGWTNQPNDPMFNYPQLDQRGLIRMMVTTRSLTNPPGKTEYYLNFGYCVLGRVVEIVAGVSYEDYVRENILRPCRITDMRVARNDPQDRFPNEVSYYQADSRPYAIDVKRMDSHGGWIASAVDLVNLLIRVDRMARVPDMLKPETLSLGYFGFQNWFHTGSLPGTTSLMERLSDRIGYAVLVNTRTEEDPETILKDLRQTIRGALLSLNDCITLQD